MEQRPIRKLARRHAVRTAPAASRTAAWILTAHPEVIIGDGGFGTMQALLPEPDGETVITRYMLSELIDRLDELTARAE